MTILPSELFNAADLGKVILLPLACTVITIGIEVLFQGRDNSLAKLYRSRENRAFEIFAWFFLLTDLYAVVFNFLAFGMWSHIRKYTAFHSIDLFRQLAGETVWQAIGAAIVALIFYDFLNYWNHRLRHEWPVLWYSHRFHHSTTEVTAFSTFRFHLLDYPSRMVFVIFPLLFVMGPSMMTLLWIWFFELLTQTISHSRLDTGFGPFGHILVSPRYHRNHHLRRGDRGNYALIFSVWDRLFGTKVPPLENFESPTGVYFPGGYQTQGPTRAFLREFYAEGKLIRRWARRLTTKQRRKNQ